MNRCNDLIPKIFLAAFAAIAIPSGGLAGPRTIDGVIFTEASSNVRLVDVSGTGTLGDPFVLVEEINGPGDAIIAIDVQSVEFGSRVATFHRVGFALVKVVINQTQDTWRFFNIELETTLGSGSDYYDGLSFGQEAKVNRPFASDRFGSVEDIIEPRDVLRFREGVVKPGDRATFRLAVTHTGPTPMFYLVQHMRRPVSVGEPWPRLAALTADRNRGAAR
jgi:hypothetical protein